MAAAAIPEFYLYPTLSNYVRQETQKAGTFDCTRKITLFLLAHGCDAGRNDFSAFRDITLQQLHIFVVNC